MLLKSHADILIIEFDLLHFRGSITFTAIANPISTEIVVGRTLAAVSTICLKFLSIAVFFQNRLVDIIPDKTTLISWFGIGKVCVFVHCPAGISHRMGVLTADKRFFLMLCQKLLNIFHAGVHLAFHVARAFISAVIENSLIMYKTVRIYCTEFFGHIKNDFSAVGFISHRPDQDRRMVFIPLIAGVHAV